MSVVPLRPTGRPAPPYVFLQLEIARYAEREMKRRQLLSEYLEAVAVLKRDLALLKLLQLAELDREQKKREVELDHRMQQVVHSTLSGPTE